MVTNFITISFRMLKKSTIILACSPIFPIAMPKAIKNPIKPVGENCKTKKKALRKFLHLFNVLMLPANPDFTETQNHSLGKLGKDHSGSSAPSSLLKQGHLEHIGQDIRTTGYYKCLGIFLICTHVQLPKSNPENLLFFNVLLISQPNYSFVGFFSCIDLIIKKYIYSNLLSAIQLLETS